MNQPYPPGQPGGHQGQGVPPGAPPPGQYGQQPPQPAQYPQPGASPDDQVPQTGYTATPSTPASSSKKGRVLAIVGSVLVAVVIAVGVRVVLPNLLGGGIDVPEVGNCITAESVSNLNGDTEVVDCGSAEAAWRVVGNAGEFTESTFDATPAEEMCGAFPEAVYVLWIGEISGDGSGDGEVVCLEQLAAQ